MNKTLRAITFLFAAGTILASTGTWAPAQQSDPTLVVPFGRNKELAPAHDVYKFPYKENYIMLPLTNGTMVTEDGGMRIIVNKPVQLNKRRTTVIPLGHGAPNVSPTPIVPQGFNGGSVPQPVNRPEGVVVRRIYPQQEFVTVESSPVGQTYEEPPVTERTEALPSVVLPENSNPGLSQEHSIISPAQPAPSETTLSTSVDGTQTAPDPYGTGTPSGTSSSPDYGTQSGGYTSSDYGTQSGTYNSSDYGTQSDTSSSPDYGTQSGTYNSSDYGTQSDTSSSPDYGTPSGTYNSSDYGTQSGGYSSPDYGTQSGTSADPYQSEDSSETSDEETPTSAWRSTTSNPAETYDSGTVGESPMIMSRQESNRSSNSWETQSAKPQVEETVSPVMTGPSSQGAQTSQASVPQNSEASPASQIRYVEVRPRRHSANRAPQNRNSVTSPARVPAGSSPTSQTVPQTAPQSSTQPASQYQAPREIPAQLPPPDPGKQTPKPSSDGRKV